MDRSRSKRSYYYDHQDYDSSENFSRTKPRYGNPANHHFSGNRHRPSVAMGSGGGGGAGGGGRTGGKVTDSSSMVTTCYRILCHDLKAGGVIGKSGSIIKAIRQHTGAWINVHELIPGDEERIIEISDTRRRDPDGRMPAFSPAQEALFLIHERILESEVTGYGGGYDEGEYGGIRGGVGAGAGGYRVVTRLVVSQQHVGSLLGKGGKIIEQMRIETKTQIRILPRDHTLPRCVSEGEEIVQVVGDANAVKNAIAVISSRLRESQHRDRGRLQNRFHSEDRFFEEDLMPNNGPRRSSVEGAPYGSRPMSFSVNNRNNSYGLRSSGYDLEDAPMAEHSQIPFEDIVFRILCPNDRVDSVVGESDGIVDLLQNEIGVDVKVSDHVAESDERVIIISSDEGPDDELFPAQEALLHIQTRIVDLVPDSDNIVTTRLVVPSTEVRCFGEGNGLLSEIKNLTGADVEVLSRDRVPAVISETDELVQIVGEIKAAREALVQVTARLRSYLYQDVFRKDMMPTSDKPEAPSPKNMTASREGFGTDTRIMPENIHSGAATHPSKVSGVPDNETSKQALTSRREEIPTTLNRVPKPLVTKSTLEVVIPDYAVPKLLAKSKNKLAQISELSGANVTLVEDDPEVTEKVIRISGTPEQVERAQSLLQGFLLSIQEDGP